MGFVGFGDQKHRAAPPGGLGRLKFFLGFPFLQNFLESFQFFTMTWDGSTILGGNIGFQGCRCQSRRASWFGVRIDVLAENYVFIIHKNLVQQDFGGGCSLGLSVWTIPKTGEFRDFG